MQLLPCQALFLEVAQELVCSQVTHLGPNVMQMLSGAHCPVPVYFIHNIQGYSHIQCYASCDPHDEGVISSNSGNTF